MEDCLFCKIIAGSIPSTKVYEDEYCYAFRDIAPMAPTHVLVVSREHVKDVGEASEKLPDAVLAAMLRASARIARMEGLQNGYRVTSNCGPDALQSVPHWHIHVLGGKKMENMV